ncbi:hypothetical protein U8Q05_26885 (plasmid) [Rhizobium ruizarguesonis]|nr:hypothetical protein U8Q05_26885 [Rhizobium ruizarguesonis]
MTSVIPVVTLLANAVIIAFFVGNGIKAKTLFGGILQAFHGGMRFQWHWCGDTGTTPAPDWDSVLLTLQPVGGQKYSS